MSTKTFVNDDTHVYHGVFALDTEKQSQAGETFLSHLIRNRRGQLINHSLAAESFAIRLRPHDYYLSIL